VSPSPSDRQAADGSSPAPAWNNAELVRDLQSTGPARARAIEALRGYLLRAVLVYLTHHRSDLGAFHFDELRQLAEDWTQEAVLQVLANLDGFRGDSKFTTWAYRVAINLVAGELRRKRWDTTSLDALAESEAPALRAQADDGAPSPEVLVARHQIWESIRSVIDEALTDRQRAVLTRVVLDGAPIEVVAEELATNPNNVYKLVHDARRKLRTVMAQRGWSPQDVLAAFAPPGGE